MTTPVVVVLTSGTSWTVPSDCSGTLDKVELIGGGASASLAFAGSGGGEYRADVNLSGYVPGSTITYQIGSGGSDNDGGSTSWNSGLIVAMGGKAGSTTGAGGTGGTGGIGGSTHFDGGSGGVGATSSTSNYGYGGGGGSAGANGTATTNGAGGNNYAGTGSGNGSSPYPSSTTTPTSGTTGGGGGGQSIAFFQYAPAGGNGIDMAGGTAGSGGGGGSGFGGGGNGGLYGGGAGGGNSYPAPLGGQGAIVITYTPGAYIPSKKPRRLITIMG